MIQFLDSERIYTNRNYLQQFYNFDILVVTDNDLDNVNQCRRLVLRTIHKHKLLDITHNPLRIWPMDLAVQETLTNNVEFYYHPFRDVKFFPLFLWAFSERNSVWWSNLVFDNTGPKTIPIMCLNNQTRPHRTYLRQCLSPVVHKMIYTMDSQGLPNEQHLAPASLNQVDIAASVYGECAVNLVTETVVDHAYVSEKTCKPFMARQIPIIVGGAGISRFLHNIGLDMFEDLVPWRSWDDEPRVEHRIQKIANFVIDWVNRGTILQDYHRMQSRIDANKTYFHSQQFRDKIMWQMTT